MKKALMLVDLQTDFFEGGALGAFGATVMAQQLAAFLESCSDEYAMVIASRDWHEEGSSNAGHFALDAEPDYFMSWPVHCVAGNPGADYHESLDVAKITHHIYKGHGSHGYSVFEGVDETDVPLHDLLQRSGVSELDVCGIAADYCVRASVLDACKLGYRVRVLSEYVVGIGVDSTKEAYVQMQEAGAHIC